MRLRVIVYALDHSARLAACASLLLTAAGRPPAASRAAALTPGTPPPLYLPFIASAGSEIAPSLAGLIPPGVGVVLAEADALGEHATVTAAGPLEAALGAGGLEYWYFEGARLARDGGEIALVVEQPGVYTGVILDLAAGQVRGSFPGPADSLSWGVLP